MEVSRSHPVKSTSGFVAQQLSKTNNKANHLWGWTAVRTLYSSVQGFYPGRPDKSLLHICCSKLRAADQERNSPCQKNDLYLEQQPLRLFALQHFDSASTINYLSRLSPAAIFINRSWKGDWWSCMYCKTEKAIPHSIIITIFHIMSRKSVFNKGQHDANHDKPKNQPLFRSLICAIPWCCSCIHPAATDIP